MSERKRFLGYSSRDHPAFVNALRRYAMTEILWNHTESLLRSSGLEYSQVILTRDDVFWVDDLHMERFPDTGTIYSGILGGLCHRSASPGAPNDRVLIMGGQV